MSEENEAIDEDDTRIVGDATKARIFAMEIDGIVATLLAGLVAAKVPGLPDIGRGALLVVIYLSYFLLSEGLWSTTPGKALFKLRVEKLDGTKSDWREAWIRTSFRIIEVNPLLLGAIPGGVAIMFSERNQRLGDRAAGTIVVPIRTRNNAGTTAPVMVRQQ